MVSNGLYLESLLSLESSSESISAEVLTDEEEGEEGLREEEQEEVIQYITYNTLSETLEYDTAEMVNISCSGLLIGCGIALFSFLIRLSIKSVLSTFRAFTGVGKEEL